jgi:hypothetical protein
VLKALIDALCLALAARGIRVATRLLWPAR